MSDIVERAISPFNPATNTVQNRDKYHLFAPMASTNRIGMAGFNPKDFTVNEQIVSISESVKLKLLPRIDVNNIPPEIRYDGPDGFKTPNVWYYNDNGAILVTYKEGIQSEFDVTNNRFRELTIVDGAVTIVGSWRSIFDELGNIDDDLNSIFDLLDTKVDKIPGKGLSDTNFTQGEKDKLAGIQAGAQVNIIETVNVEGSSLPVSNKIVNVTKESLSLELVNNTTDMNKPVSTAQKTYIDDGDLNTLASAKAYTDAEKNRAISVETELSLRIDAQEGLGGFLEAVDFGSDTPSESELTDYALSQIPSIENDYTKIWNGTSVTNLYDNQVWRLNNNYPADFSWSKIGDVAVAKATNTRLGIVKGGDTIKVDSTGAIYTSPALIGAATEAQGVQMEEAIQDLSEGLHLMNMALGVSPICDTNGFELCDIEGNSLVDVDVNARRINGHELIAMTKAEHDTLVQTGVYKHDAFYLTF